MTETVSLSPPQVDGSDRLAQPSPLSPPTSPPVSANPWPTGPAPDGVASPSAIPPLPARSTSQSSSGTRKRPTWIALGALGILVALAGAYFVVDRYMASRNSESANEHQLPPLPTDVRIGWIPSATYKIPDEIGPGLYRVARGYTRFEKDNDVAVAAESTFEGTTLVVIEENNQAGTIEIEGGAWPLKENGPVDPTRFEDGMYLVGFDIEPGTYRVTPVTNWGNVAGAGTVDKHGKVTKAEHLDSADATASAEGITIVIEPTDFAFYFSGHLERVD